MIPLSSETIINLYGFKITNTFIVTFIVDAILVWIIFKINRNISIYPAKFQNIVETVIEYFYNLTEQIADKRAKSIFPWFASFFIFIFCSNILGIFPGFGTIGIFELEGTEKKLIPLFRAVTNDFNTTFALAVVSLVATHVLSIKYNGLIEYLKRFFSLNPIFLFVGLLEIISELTKLISLSFRLFGNIFAGEVVLTTISSLFAYLAPVPFLMLESIVALVQALVFSMLTMVFMSILTTPHTE
jgi:F-type H+-transporting ATPase subunit a